MLKTKNQSRNSSVELLRIIAMLFIVLSHACFHSNFDIASSSLNFNRLFVQWGVLGNLGVDIFVLISGYYLCKKMNNLQSIIRLLLQVWFYSLLLFLVCWLLFDYHYSMKEYFQVFFPTIFQEYWFFTAYIVLIILCPYINILLEKLERRLLERLICVMLFLWIIIPTFTLQNMFGGDLAQFILFYVIGAYFRLYPDHFLSNRNRRVCLLICSFALLFISTFALEYLGEIIPPFTNKGNLFYGRNSLLIIACAVGLFTSAIHGRVFHNKVINMLGACTFGVYLIHDNPAVRNIIWIQLLKNAEFFSSPFLFLRIIGSVLLVFSISTMIEYLRLTYLEDHICRWANKVIEQISIRLNKYKSR